MLGFFEEKKTKERNLQHKSQLTYDLIALLTALVSFRVQTVDCDLLNSAWELCFRPDPACSQLFEQPRLDVLRLEAVNDGVNRGGEEAVQQDEQNAHVQAEGKSHRVGHVDEAPGQVKEAGDKYLRGACRQGLPASGGVGHFGDGHDDGGVGEQDEGEREQEAEHGDAQRRDCHNVDVLPACLTGDGDVVAVALGDDVGAAEGQCESVQYDGHHQGQRHEPGQPAEDGDGAVGDESGVAQRQADGHEAIEGHHQQGEGGHRAQVVDEEHLREAPVEGDVAVAEPVLGDDLGEGGGGEGQVVQRQVAEHQVGGPLQRPLTGHESQNEDVPHCNGEVDEEEQSRHRPVVLGVESREAKDGEAPYPCHIAGHYSDSQLKIFKNKASGTSKTL